MRTVLSIAPEALEGDGLSAMGIVAVLCGRNQRAIPAAGNKMTMALDETLRLKTARVVEAFKNPR